MFQKVAVKLLRGHLKRHESECTLLAYLIFAYAVVIVLRHFSGSL